MRSIRFSLVVYFLALEALALGAFICVIYSNSCERLESLSADTQKTLRSENAHNTSMLQERFDITQRSLRANFDEVVFLKAQKVATQTHAILSNRVSPMVASGMLGAATAPNAQLLYVLWLAEVYDPCLYGKITRAAGMFDVTIYQRKNDPWRLEQSGECFEIYFETGKRVYSSPSLGQDHLPLQPAWLKEMKTSEHRFEDVKLGAETKLRQVTLKYAVFPWYPFNFVRKPDPIRRTPRPDELRAFDKPRIEDSRPFDSSQLPQFYLQYAVPTAELEAALQGFEGALEENRADMIAKMHETLREQEQASQEALVAVRNKLIVIGLLAFGFTALGGVWLVRRGLRPIQRIADAVSQVSEKDFQLRLTPEKTPTELASIVEKLHETLQSLKNAFEREKQAAADISHELRTPIASLLATVQVCLRKPRQVEEYRKTLQTCAEIGRQLGGLVERLLALARLDAGTDQLSVEPVDVPDLAAQCVEQIRPLAETQELSLRFERNGPICVETDAGKLREVLLNLLHNAMQYNRPQGSVEVSVSANDGHARLAVRDTGVGIPNQALPHLFERFYRVDPARQSDTIHAGLGLSIVKGYLDLMGAAIQVESVEGQGSTFSVLLPLAKETTEEILAGATGVHSA